MTIKTKKIGTGDWRADAVIGNTLQRVYGTSRMDVIDKMLAILQASGSVDADIRDGDWDEVVE